jgi:transposase
MARHEIGALIQVLPNEARKRIVDLYVKARCSQYDAAKIAGCDHHTFARWVSALDIREALREIERRALAEGWHHGKRGGRPPKPSSSKRGAAP